MTFKLQAHFSNEIIVFTSFTRSCFTTDANNSTCICLMQIIYCEINSFHQIKWIAAQCNFYTYMVHWQNVLAVRTINTIKTYIFTSLFLNFVKALQCPHKLYDTLTSIILNQCRRSNIKYYQQKTWLQNYSLFVRQSRDTDDHAGIHVINKRNHYLGKSSG